MLGVIARRGAKLLSYLLICLALAFGLLLARLALGPISLQQFAPEIESRINASLDGWSIDLDDVVLGWDAQANRIRVRLQGVSLYTPGGRLAASAPSAGLRFHLADALRGKISVTGAELLGLEALLLRTPDGRFRFAVLDGAAGAAPKEVSPEAFDAVAAAIDAAASHAGAARSGPKDGEPADDDALARFERLRIADLDLRYVDQMSGSEWTLPHSDFEIRQGEAGIEASLIGELLTAPDSRPVSLALTGVRSAEGDTVELKASFQDAPTAAIASQAPEIAVLGRVEGRLSGSAEASLDLKNGDLLSLSGRVAADGAQMKLSETRSLVFQTLAADMAFDPKSDGLHLNRLDAVNLRGDKLSAKGDAWLIRDTDGSVTAIDGGLDILEAALVDPALFAEPFRIPSGRFEFSINTYPWSLKLSSARIETADTVMTGWMDATLTPELTLKAEARFSDFPALRLAPLWPLPAAPGGRRWVDENIKGGQLQNAVLKASIEKDGPPELDFSFRFDDLSSTYIEGMSPITRGVGQGKLLTDSFTLSIDSAEVDLGDQGAVQLAGSTFTIPSFEPEFPDGEIDIHAQGPFAALLSLLDQKPLELVSKLGRDFGTIGGEIDATARVEVPLIADLPMEKVSVKADGTVADLSLIAPWIEQRVHARTAEISADVTQLHLTGVGRIDRHDIAVDWREVFAPEAGEPRTTLDLGVTLSARTLVEWGAPEQFVRGGGARAKAALRIVDGRPVAMEGSLDINRLLLAAPAFGWAKAAGSAGTVRFAGEIGAQGATLSQISVNTDGLKVEGGGMLDAEGVLRTLTLDKLIVGDGTELALTIARSGESDTMRITGGGPKLQFTLGALGASEEGPPAGDPVEFDLKVDALRVGDETRLRDVTANGRRGRDGVVEGDATGHTHTGAAMVARLGREGASQTVVLSSEQAGEAVVGLGLLKKASGGRMRLSATVGADGVANGALDIDNIVIQDAPQSLQALQIGSLVGVFEQAANSGGILFTRVRAPFRITSSAFELEDAWARGPSLGLVLDGTISRPEGELDLRGAVSPAFVLNGLLSDVPVIGDILTGGQGEGILAVNFSVRGDSEDPQVSVNPLTALTPGVFRRIFRGGDGSTDSNDGDRRNYSRGD